MSFAETAPAEAVIPKDLVSEFRASIHKSERLSALLQIKADIETADIADDQRAALILDVETRILQFAEREFKQRVAELCTCRRQEESPSIDVEISLMPGHREPEYESTEEKLEHNSSHQVAINSCSAECAEHVRKIFEAGAASLTNEEQTQRETLNALRKLLAITSERIIVRYRKSSNPILRPDTGIK